MYGFLAVGWLLLAMHAGNGYAEAMKAAEHAATTKAPRYQLTVSVLSMFLKATYCRSG